MQTEIPDQANDGLVTVHLRDDFYRDGFRMVLLSLGMVVTATALLIIVSLYFFLHQVLPITFPVYEDWRVQADVPLDRPYIRTPDLLQWVSTVLPKVFSYDFVNYDMQLKNAVSSFTSDGWIKYNELLNAIASKAEITNKKLFLTATMAGAPVVLNQGIIEGQYAWWVQMPINVRYSGVERNDATETKYTIQVLLVRVSTLNNLDGISIGNIILSQQGNKH